jgi:hypothetical protein
LMARVALEVEQGATVRAGHALGTAAAPTRAEQLEVRTSRSGPVHPGRSLHWQMAAAVRVSVHAVLGHRGDTSLRGRLQDRLPVLLVVRDLALEAVALGPEPFERAIGVRDPLAYSSALGLPSLVMAASSCKVSPRIFV